MYFCILVSLIKELMTALTCSMIFWQCWKMSSASMLLSRMSLSILFSTRQVLIFSSHACLSTVKDCGEIPSTTSMRTRAPSESLRAEETSLVKSTWPGESIKLILYSCWLGSTPASFCSLVSRWTFWWNSVMEEAFIVICRICSSSRESMYFSFPASFWLMIWLFEISESDNVVFPWSTWARMQMFLIISGSFCIFLIASWLIFSLNI
mmetsp:Transcript_42535/g.49670  ORF Transcript_42535/g.49670 Transcript_42535/m.49670 type:complete len:208 (-) Transcript_42535:37-660(-)